MPDTSDGGVDYRRFIFLFLKYWYIILISLIIAIVCAYFINRYTERIYSISSTILIKDHAEQDNAVVELLYNNSGFTPGKNYFNEEILLKSYPLIKKTVDELDFNLMFFRQGDIKLTEVYPGPPIRIKKDISSLPYNSRFAFQVLSKDKYRLSDLEGKKIGDFKFDEQVKYRNHSFTLYRTVDNIDSFVNQEFEILFVRNEDLAHSYSNRVRVEWLEEGSSILSLSITGAVPVKEIAFLNQLAITYQGQDLHDKNENAAKTIGFIDTQLTSISDSLGQLEYGIQQFKEKNYITGISEEAQRFYARLDMFSGQLAQFTVEEKYYNYLTGYIKENKPYEELTVPAAVGINNGVLSRLVEELIQIQLKKAEVRRTSVSESPYLAEIDSRIGDLKNNLLETIASLKSSLKIAKDDVNRQLNGVKSNIRRLPQAEKEFVNLNRLYKLSESLYLILMEKKVEASITLASTTSDIVFVNPPALTGGAITPKVSQNYLMALLLGLGIPIGLILLFDYFNDKVKFKEDLEKHSTIPLIGVIGHNPKENNLVVESSPKSGIAESFRSIRSNLNFFVDNKQSKVILVTSSLSGEGKTFFSNNLALILEYSTKDTVLIGADMRRPRIFEDFNVHNDIGLSSYLASDVSLDDVLQDTRFEKLKIINSGVVPPNPSELLLKDRLPQLIEELRERFEYIIIDSPPVGLVTDSLILSKHVDHTIYVVRQGYTPIGTIKNIQELYESEMITDLSLLFNDITVNKYGYGYNYSYGYGYTYGKSSSGYYN